MKTSEPIQYSDQCKKWIAYRLNLLINCNYHVYCILADYREHNPNKPDYYVIAKNAVEAKKRFKQRVSWLKIYSCKECDSKISETIVSNPGDYIVF